MNKVNSSTKSFPTFYNVSEPANRYKKFLGLTYCCFRRLLIFHDWRIEIFNLWFFNDPWRPSRMYYMCGYFMCLVMATVRRLVFISWWYLRRSLHTLALDFMIQAFFRSSVVQVTQGVVPNFFYKRQRIQINYFLKIRQQMALVLDF